MRLQTFLRACVLTFVVCISFPQSTNSANILFYFGLSTYSHRLIAWPLVEALVERNHSVTFFQPDKNKNKNPNPKVTEVNPVGGIGEKLNFMEGRLNMGHRLFLLSLTYKLPQLSLGLCESFMQDQQTVDWIKNSKFDLIVIDALFNECAYGIAHLHKAKTIIFGTSHPFGWMPDSLGYPSEANWLPELHFSFDLPLNFINRVLANLSVFYFHAIRYLTFPKIEAVLREKLGIPDMPSIPELMANTSLMFTNTHFSEELARSHPPNIISIGGMNCKEKSQLNLKSIPKDILEFIDGSGDEGFILVSFGSGARIIDAPEDIQDIFFNAFGKTKTRFILKWENESPARLPSNVKTVKWIPQQEILAHPKIRGFITHGGLLSMHEAICHQVPMIAFPVFAEQDYNGERLNRTERGITLDITALTEEILVESIQKLLYDERYKKNVIQVSKRFMDRPMKPVETAVWWTEYVLRQEDTDFMRPLSIYQTWYQRRQLDVWLFLATIIVIFIYTSAKILGFAFRKIFTKRLNEPRKVSKKKIN